MIKRLISGGMFLLLSLFLCQCNGDVFIEELRPSATELELDGNGGTQTINFKSSYWGIKNVYQDPLSSKPFPYSWKSFDSNGNPIEHTGSDDFWLEGLGKVVFYDSEGLELLRLERNKGKKLTVVAVENPDSSPWELFIDVDNNDDVYNSEIIRLTISPCERYEVTGFTFDRKPSFFSDYTCHRNFSFEIDNSQSDIPNTQTYFPYSWDLRRVTFRPDDWTMYAKLVEEAQAMVELPVCQNKELLPGGVSVTYTNGTVEIPLADTEEKATVEIPARTKQYIEVWLMDEIYETRYTITVRNPKTGRERSFTGGLESQTPYDYFLIRKTVEQ